MSCFSGQPIDPQLLEMKTSQFIIAHPRIGNCSTGKWVGYDIFQNKVLSPSCYREANYIWGDLQASKDMFAF